MGSLGQGPQEVLRYLARYTQRVAISNRRLIWAEDNGVASPSIPTRPSNRSAPKGALDRGQAARFEGRASELPKKHYSRLGGREMGE
jgi:hypothetical protein